MKRTSLTRRTPLRPRAPKKPWRRKPEDRVPDWLYGYLYARDRMCVPHRVLGAPGECVGRLTIEHVRDADEPATGKRAPSDKRHTLIACLGANTGWCLLASSKRAERDYLSRVELEDSVW